MDPKQAKSLIEAYCAELAEKRRGLLARVVRPVGLGLALGALSLGGCGDDTTSKPPANDAYGVADYRPADFPQSADAYGIPMPDLPQANDAYGIIGDLPTDAEQKSDLPQAGDAYGIPGG